MSALMKREDQEAYEARHVDEGDFLTFDKSLRELFRAPPEVAAASDVRFHAEGLVRPTLDNIELLPMYESLRLLSVILKSAKGDLLAAGAGVVVSTAASLGSLFF